MAEGAVRAAKEDLSFDRVIGSSACKRLVGRKTDCQLRLDGEFGERRESVTTEREGTGELRIKIPRTPSSISGPVSASFAKAAATTPHLNLRGPPARRASA